MKVSAALVAVVLLVAATPAPMAGETAVARTAHALWMYGDLKYGKGFTHFDYVTPGRPGAAPSRSPPSARSTT